MVHGLTTTVQKLTDLSVKVQVSVTGVHPVDTRRQVSLDLMLSRRRRRLASIKSTFGQRLAFAAWI